MQRLLGLDVGDKTIGIAVSDPLGLTAQGIKTIRRTSIKKDIKEIIEIIEEYNIVKLIVGLPKNMNNTLGPQGEKVFKFVERLKEKKQIEIIYQDERLTTVSAQKTLIEADMSRSKRKKVVDKLAAVYILQTYLDMNK
ncbi:Holliday junction resolvase RuvX [Clostridium sp. D2Q-14]|uniref:Holliday junction resolvase RuvX n=1 Tax=Anaeromonas gelatinilytica TaxID=2683194 RepID=UPI00193C4D51|nr:Holliday junction resolvase RuvX [Anaeromonas gelatinilytica]MBS4535371.1 Holliday junction resolvase RuvX [Anaeromonas gelatinilytica]